MSAKNFKDDILANIEKQQKSLAGRFDSVEDRMRNIPTRVQHVDLEQPPGASKKIRVVKDSFSMPADDYAVIETVQLLAAENRLLRSKSEVVRAALQYFDSAGESHQLAILSKVVKIGYGPKR